MTNLFVLLRPGVNEFLKILSNYYEIFIFTASCKDYADPILSLLDPDGMFIDDRLYREHCNEEGIKNLLNLGINLKDIVMIDNCENSFKL